MIPFSLKKVSLLFLFILINATFSYSQEIDEVIDTTLFEQAGIVSGTGSFLEVTNSEYINVSLSSSIAVAVKIESVPEMVTLYIDSVGNGVSSNFELTGFAPFVAYHLYVDGLQNHTVLNADENGTIRFTQDLSTSHVLFIQPNPSTYYLEESGWRHSSGNPVDPSLLSWDSETKTGSLLQNINESIEIRGNNITLNGNSNYITGGGNGIVVVGYSNTTIENVNIRNFTHGIRISGPNTIVRNSTISNCSYSAIYIAGNASGFIIENCDIYSINNITINISQVSSGKIIGNNIHDNPKYGIYITNSNNIDIMDNTIDNISYDAIRTSTVSGLNVTNNTMRNNNIALFFYYNTTNGTVASNTITGGPQRGAHAIVFIGTENFEIYGNTFSNNSDAFFIRRDDRFPGPVNVYRNRFYGTPLIVTDENYGNPAINKFVMNQPMPIGGNFYSSHTTPDNNGDDIVDYPYTIHPGYEMVDRFPWATSHETLPITNANVSGTIGASGWYSSNVSVSFSVSDENSDPVSATTEYSFDETNWISYNEPIVISDEGIHKLYFKSFDSWGNKEVDVKSLEIKIDKTAPTSLFGVAGTPGVFPWYISDVTVNITANDNSNGSGLNFTEYSFDNTNWMTYVQPIILNEEGENRVYARSTDIAGNLEDLKYITANIDQTSPQFIVDRQTIEVDATSSEGTLVNLATPEVNDNLDPSVVVTSDAPADNIFPLGTTVVTFTATDAAGNKTITTIDIIVTDNSAPVPAVATLETVTGECSVEITNVPTAADNCAGNIVASTNDPLTYSVQGEYVITWTYDDGNGNVATQTQNVSVKDETAPVPTVATLETITGECSVEITNIPTANDNCAGNIVASTNDPLTYSVQGEYVITWTYDDGNGNVATQTQNVSVKDETAPVPAVANLETVTGECSVEITNIPTANDNCAGNIVASTNDPLTYSVQGEYVITWTYDDGNGNVATQTQNVSVKDETAPVPAVANLETVTGECSVEITNVPTAADNCAGNIVASTNDPLTYSLQGEYVITWTYDDGNGNVATQTQNVSVKDETAPVPAVANLETVAGECSVEITNIPTANDNCAGNIVASTNDPLTYSVQGEYVITWTYDDGNGNVATQTQNVSVKDETAPVPAVATLETVTGECSVEITNIPTANDNCAGNIVASTNDPLTYSVQGEYVITWTYDDGNGNVATQTQNVSVKDETAPVFTNLSQNIEVVASSSEGANVDIEMPTATDNCDNAPVIESDAPSDNKYPLGATTITYTATDYSGNSTTATVIVTVIDQIAPVITISGITNDGSYNNSITPEISVVDNESGIQNISIKLNGTPYVSGTAISTKGLHSLLVVATDNAGNNSTSTINFKVYKNTELEVFSKAVQYSDIATLTAKLTSQESNISGKEITFKVGGDIVGSALTNAEGIASVNFQALLPVNSYVINASFAGDVETYITGSTGDNNLTVNYEDASISYSGELLVPYPNSVDLSAIVTQAADGSLGNLSNATVRFEVSLINSDGTLTEAGIYDAACNESGTAITTASLAVGVYSITANVINNNYYISSKDIAITPVYDPNGGFATGGGWINVTNIDEGNLGKSNFGFIAKYKKGEAAGNLSFKYSNGDLNLKSTQIDWLVVSATSAQFEGTGTIENRPGTFKFRVNCTDNKISGSADKFTIKIWTGSDEETGLIYKALNQDLAGGNILVKKK